MDTARTPLREAEFEEIMNRNRAISSSAISRAVSDASAGLYLSVLIFLIYVIRNDLELLKNDFSLGCGQAFPGGSKQGLLSSCGALAYHCGGFSCCGAQTRHTGFGSCSTLGQ